MLAFVAAAMLLPVNPFLTAKAGDWWVLETRQESGPRRVRWEIVKIKGDELDIRLRNLDAPSEQAVMTRASRSAPLLSLYDLDAPSPPLISAEECTLGDRKLSCKKLAYKVEGLEVTAYFSDQVNGGLLSASSSGAFGSVSTRLVAYGTAKKVTFGKAP